MGEMMLLWNNTAPDTEKCFGQDQPYMIKYPVDGVRQAVIVCPGGGYDHKCIDREGDDVCRMFQSEGIASFRLDYRISPCPYDTPLKDALRAIRLVRALGYDKVCIMGFSAGGHLSCSAATLFDKTEIERKDAIDDLSSRPDLLVACYPVSTFGKYTHKGSKKALLQDQSENEELIRRFSAEMNADENTPPAFIWHTADDNGVPCQNSLLLAQALSDKGVEYELHIYPHGPHGMGMAQDDPVVSAWTKECIRFVKAHGFGK